MHFLALWVPNGWDARTVIEITVFEGLFADKKPSIGTLVEELPPKILKKNLFSIKRNLNKCDTFGNFGVSSFSVQERNAGNCY